MYDLISAVICRFVEMFAVSLISIAFLQGVQCLNQIWWNGIICYWWNNVDNNLISNTEDLVQRSSLSRFLTLFTFPIFYKCYTQNILPRHLLHRYLKKPLFIQCSLMLWEISQLKCGLFTHFTLQLVLSSWL